MSTTIHYQLRAGGTTAEVLKLLIELRSRARELHLREVGPVVQWTGRQCDHRRYPMHQWQWWLLVQAAQSVTDGLRRFEVGPSHMIAFTTWPGPGCEPANFGLCRYPGSIEVPASPRSGKRQAMATGLAGWSWRSFCNTQQAGRAEHGGWDNCLRCYQAVLDLLRHAQELGILHSVHDEAGLWKKSQRPVAAGS